MATLIPADGTPIYIEPANGRSFTLEELQTIVGGYIEMLRTPLVAHDEQLLMFLNEDGKRLQLPRNGFATALMYTYLRPDDCIVGTAIICTRIEAGEDEGSCAAAMSQ